MEAYKEYETSAYGSIQGIWLYSLGYYVLALLMLGVCLWAIIVTFLKKILLEVSISCSLLEYFKAALGMKICKLLQMLA